MYFSGFHMHHAPLLRVRGWIITAACLLYCTASSPDATIDLHGLSQHPGDGTYTHNGKSRNYNSRNWGIGLAQNITGYDDTPLEGDKYLRAVFLQAGIEHNKTRLTFGFNEEVSILFLSYTP